MCGLCSFTGERHDEVRGDGLLEVSEASLTPMGGSRRWRCSLFVASRWCGTGWTLLRGAFSQTVSGRRVSFKLKRGSAPEIEVVRGGHRPKHPPLGSHALRLLFNITFVYGLVAACWRSCAQWPLADLFRREYGFSLIMITPVYLPEEYVASFSSNPSTLSLSTPFSSFLPTGKTTEG